jgi:hypothetical protein
VSANMRSPRMRRASWMSLGMMVMRLAWMAQRLVSSNSPTRYASAASCSAETAELWNRRTLTAACKPTAHLHISADDSMAAPRCTSRVGHLGEGISNKYGGEGGGIGSWSPDLPVSLPLSSPAASVGGSMDRRLGLGLLHSREEDSSREGILTSTGLVRGGEKKGSDCLHSTRKGLSRKW